MECFAPRRQNNAVDEPDYKQLMKVSPFTKKELQAMFQRFELLADDVNGLLHKREFLSMNELAFCPIAEMVFEKESIRWARDDLDFQHFVRIMSVFSVTTPIDQKEKYLFELISTEESPDFITKEELTQLMIRMSRGAQVPEDSVRMMVEEAWKIVARDDKITFDVFQEQISSFDLHTLMTVDF